MEMSGGAKPHAQYPQDQQNHRSGLEKRGGAYGAGRAIVSMHWCLCSVMTSAEPQGFHRHRVPKLNGS